LPASQQDVEAVLCCVVDRGKEQTLVSLCRIAGQMIEAVKPAHISRALWRGVRSLDVPPVWATELSQAAIRARPLIQVKDRNVVMLGELGLLASHDRLSIGYEALKLIAGLEHFNLGFGLAKVLLSA
jgi:hypothetical protein